MGPSKDTRGTLGPLRRKAVGGPPPTPQKAKSRCNDASPRQSDTHMSSDKQKGSSSKTKCEGSSKIVKESEAGKNKGLSSSSTEKENMVCEITEERDVTFIVIQKKVMSLNSSDRFNQLIRDAEGCKWDALLISETWRSSKAEIWETRQGHIYIGARKFENTHELAYY